MRDIVTKICLLKSLEYCSLFRRKWPWILVPGILTPLLAVIMIRDSGGSNPALPISHAANRTQPQSSVSQTESLRSSRLSFISLALIVGLITGVGLAVFLELKSGSVRSEIELTRLTKIPVLTSIPLLQDKSSALLDDQHRL
jgi:hypothetical protein